MGTITKRQTKDGKYRYRAQVRVSQQGLPNFTKSKTFSKESLAKEWIKKIEAEIELNPDLLKHPTQSQYGNTLSHLITHYLDETKGQYNDKYEANLKRIAKYSIAKINVFQLTRQDFSSFALWRRRGEPINMIDGVSPATVLKDLTEISGVLNHAIMVWGLTLAHVKSELEHALYGLKKSRIVSKSPKRDRLPTADELQLLTNYFYRSWVQGRGTIPMHLIMWFAIYTGRREGEIATMRLSDFDRPNNQWLIRDVKRPDGSTGNHKYAHLEPLAIQMIDEFLQSDVRNRMLLLGYDENLLVPVNPQTISDYFTKACKVLEINDLRFHDLRHESATRYAEDGFTIPQLQTITLHSSWESLKVYVNLKKRGERLDFEQAIAFAGQQLEQRQHQPKKRHINQVEIANAEHNLKIAQNPDVIKAQYDFIQPLLEQFVTTFKPSKTIIDSLKAQRFHNIFAWDNARQQFVVAYIQENWQQFLRQSTFDWQVDNSTHFDTRTLDILKIDNFLVYKYHGGEWVNITAYYTVNQDNLIS